MSVISAKEAFETALRLMTALGFEIDNRGIPTVEFVPSLGTCSGLYYPSRHHVVYSHRWDKGETNSTLVHEMVHSLQPKSVLQAGPSYNRTDGGMDYRLYCEDLAECQARAVQAAMEFGLDDVIYVIRLAGSVVSADPLWPAWRALRKGFGERAGELLGDLMALTGASGKDLKEWALWAYKAGAYRISRAAKPQHLPVSRRKAVNAMLEGHIAALSMNGQKAG